jgi:phosphorylcholine metabolism protein LicD
VRKSPIPRHSKLFLLFIKKKQGMPLQKKYAFLTVSLIILTITLCTVIPICIRVIPTRSIVDFQQELLSLFKVFEQVAKDYNITYWASFGTCLGAKREGKIIPWDDDMDLEIWEEDKQVLIKHENEIIQKYGICFTRDIVWNSVGTLKIEYVNYNKYPKPFIDCVTMMKKDNKIIIKSPFTRATDPTCYHDLSSMVLENIPFEDTVIPVPTSDSFLENCYGKDWRTPKKRYSHYFYIDGKMPLILSIVLGMGGFFVLISLAFLVVALVTKETKSSK